MKVRIYWDAQFCGQEEGIVEVSDSATAEEIKAVFPRELGIKFDENCGYEVLE